VSGRAVRAAAHVHSGWSYDGRSSLAEIASTFGRLGYRIVLLSEHDRGFDDQRWREYRRACEQASGPEVLLVPGIEYSDAANDVHVLVWGCGGFLGEGLETPELLDRVRASSGVAVLAHPARRQAYSLLDPGCLELLDGVEVWNRKYDGVAPSRAAVELLASHPARRLLPFVGLDFHTRRQLFPLTMLLRVDGALEPETVEESLRARRASAHAFGAPVGIASAPAGMTALGTVERARRATRDGLRAIRG
jgi:hypothetical protein